MGPFRDLTFHQTGCVAEASKTAAIPHHRVTSHSGTPVPLLGGAWVVLRGKHCVGSVLSDLPVPQRDWDSAFEVAEWWRNVCRLIDIIPRTQRESESAFLVP